MKIEELPADFLTADQQQFLQDLKASDHPMAADMEMAMQPLVPKLQPNIYPGGVGASADDSKLHKVWVVIAAGSHQGLGYGWTHGVYRSERDAREARDRAIYEAGLEKKSMPEFLEVEEVELR